MKSLLKSVVAPVIGISLALVLVGCSAKGPQFSAIQKIEKDKGLLYVYRPSSFVGGGVSFDIHVTDSNKNDKVIGTLKNGGYMLYQAQPQEFEIWAKTEAKSSVTIDIEQNKMYCIKGEVGIGFLVGRPHLTIVDNNLCKEELKKTQLSID